MLQHLYMARRNPSASPYFNLVQKPSPTPLVLCTLSLLFFSGCTTDSAPSPERTQASKNAVAPSFKQAEKNQPNRPSSSSSSEKLGSTLIDKLGKSSYHEYIIKHPSEIEPLTQEIVKRVNLPPAMWAQIPLPERAKRAVNYIQLGAELCGITRMDSSPREAQKHLDAIAWSPYVTRSTIDKATQGDVGQLQEIETIRQMYECAIGSSLDANMQYTPQIKDNLTSKDYGVYNREGSENIFRDDYRTNGGNSSLLVESVAKNGGRVQALPIFGNVVEDGGNVSAPSPAWFRSPGMKEENMNYSFFPLKSTQEQKILLFGYSWIEK